VTEWAGLDADQATTRTAPKQNQAPKDYSAGRKREADYLQAMRANIHDPEAVAYIQGRGFTMDEAVAWGLGYDPTRHRLILPWAGSDYYHIDRSTTDQEPKYTKPKATDVGPQPLYNSAALEAPVFFVVEGVLDALAVKACGFDAIALGGTATRAAVEAMTARKTRGVAIIMLDNDKEPKTDPKTGKLTWPGQDAQKELYGKLTSCGIAAMTATTETKDAAEWLQADRDALTAFLQAEYDQAGQLVDNMRESAYNAALARLRVMNPADVTETLYDLTNATPPIPTGFSSLDAILGGGLQPGLYVLGAVSSLGKTTFCVQVADQVAATGRAVLFVTIEQSAAEITAKSLSRIMSACGKSYSTTDVSSPTRREAWTTTDYSRFAQACNSYTSEVAPTLRILEGNKQPSVDDVRAVAEVMADYYGQAPTIFLDYLQLLAPQSDRDSDKQATDKNVMALRQMARDLQAPVFVVSSLNRSSYSEGVTMDAFKESGAIEYGADVLLGLQPEGMREHMDSAPVTRAKREADKYIRESKGAEVRACEIVVLKNRAGRTPDEGIPFTFRPVASTFREGQGAQTRQTVRRI
jgi:replicative DNA helicase